ncbi:ABC transporter substrate-binding protein [Pelagibacterium lacus]|uniref:ABC transporter substrate-binding protein n=1 Tax=Pelagibacterium lacus TaxID=2282655 RepID=A0A369W7Y1_9HYPH|nr:ABC transporter substrate-binding protein [Pelagibacterium lacus]RDE10079.1 ABC transporter substrate-binding protein [Pelagibacterium lacus]
MTVPVRIACDAFDTMRALQDGSIGVEGAVLHFETEMTNPERHRRMVRDLAFDICELNVSTYLIARERGVPITAIPIFPFRKFRHGSIFVRGDSGLTSAGELAGRRIGVPNMQPASNVWIRGILRDAGKLDDRDVTWVTEKDEEIDFLHALAARTERAPQGKRLDDLLVEGAIDAIISPLVPASVIAGDGRIRRLYPDYVARERAYFQRSGQFPIMHLMAVSDRFAREHPQLLGSLADAFERSKQAAFAQMRNVRLVSLAWFGAHWEDEQALFGPDAWPNGLIPINRQAIEMAQRYTFEQGLIGSLKAVDELFWDGGPG